MKICIDAGHAGKTTNKGVSAGYVESAVMWDYHKLLKAELEKYGVEVVTTRSGINDDPSLEKRGNTAKGCDLFISCHSNAYNYTDQKQADKTTRTCVIYSIPYETKTKGVAKAIADALAGLMKEFDPNTYGQIYQREYPNKPTVDYYGVIRGAANVGVGGIIVEHSFHTSTLYCEWAMKKGNLQRMAETEVKAIADYYGLTKGAPKPVEPVAPVAVGVFHKDDLVKIKDGAKYYKGQNIPAWVRACEWYVMEDQKNDRVVINKDKAGKYAICSPIHACDLELVNCPHKVEEAPTSPENGVIYAVQVGAYKVLANAQNALVALKNAGFDGYIVTK